MQERLPTHLSNPELMNELRRLIGVDRCTQAAVLRCLVVVDERRLYLEQGFSSLWMFCHRGLGMSESMAQRRVMAVRICRLDGNALAMVEDGRLSLCTLSLLGRHVDHENAARLLAAATHKSSRELEQLLACFAATAPRRDVVRPMILNASRAMSCLAPSMAPVGRLPATQHTVTPTVIPAGLPASQPELATSCAESERRVTAHRVSFTASEATWQNIERLKKLTGAKDLDALLAKATEALLDRCDPERREQRRERRREQAREPRPQRVEPQRCVAPLEPSRPRRPASIATRHRAVPQALRDAVLIRDGHRCTYVSAEGVRCDGTCRVEVDHVKPWALGGEHTLENLRTLCKEHNLLRARETFGAVPRGRSEKVRGRTHTRGRERHQRKQSNLVGR